MKKGNFYRRYTIDMISTYKVNKILLSFDKCDNRSKMRVKVSSVDAKNGNVKYEAQRFYNESVWSQVAKAPFGQDLEKMFKNPVKSRLNVLDIDLSQQVESRYLIVDIHFTLQPNAATKKESDTIPHNEIIPEIYGQYQGES